MAQIDTSVQHANTAARQDQGEVRGEQRQSWLKQLEAAGWKGILDTMRNFPGGSDFRPAGDMPSYAEVLHTDERSADGDAGHNGLKRAERAVQGESDAIRQMVFSPPHAQAPASGFAHLAYGMQYVIHGSEEGLEISPSRRPTEPPARDTIPERKVLVLATQENGVEVWVRDAKVTGAQMQMLLADVRRNVQNLGGAVVKVSLNGRQVYADQPNRVKSNQSKGG